MKISLIGMSNSGKSYWSRRLEEVGFIRLSCDDYIEEKLGNELTKLGYRGINDVSKWLGQPYNKQHAENSRIYLKFEIESLKKFIQFIKENSGNKNIVIDTTGSVIYIGNNILNELRRNSRIIYLDTPESVKEEVYKSYLGNPKPVIWGSAYKKKKGESNISALKRCYPHLLEYRTKKYKNLAHIELDYFLIKEHGFTIDDFLRLIRIGLYS